jgi:hypothetical protein
MKIGILLTIYNCDKYVNDCLNPWFKLKDKYNFVFAVNSGMFADYQTLGLPFRNEKTLELLSEYELDFQVTTKGKNLLFEDDSRNTCLNFLNKQDCDLIWYLDGDETYTTDQIENILDFIHRNPSPDWYSVVFKNLTIHEHLFQDYVHERIVWAKRYGGISSYYFDNQFTYKDGSKISSHPGIVIPKNLAYIKHYSWLTNDSRTKDKIIYQRLRYCGEDGQLPEDCRCTFEWDNERDVLKFSDVFHKCRGVDIPVLHEELTIFSNDFSVDFSRKNNLFNIKDVQRPVKADFEIYNGETGEHLYTTHLDMIKGVNYFIAINSPTPFNEVPNLNNFQVKVYEYDRLIHNEKIHLHI